MKGVTGTHLPDLSLSSLRAGVARLFGQYRATLDDGPLVVLPDAHYPHHASTGLVTNADVVFELCKELSETVSIDRIRIGIPGSAFVDAERAGRYLGYERIADALGIGLLDLDSAGRVERTVHLPKASVEVSLPKPLIDGTVVNVPTVRRSSRLGVEAGMANLALPTGERPDAPLARAATQVCDPAVTIVDGTYVFAGRPHKSGFLLASRSTVATSSVAAALIGLDPSAVPHLDAHGDDSDLPTTATGIDARTIAEKVPGTKPPNAGDDGALAKGYRLYARVAGDLVPPQMLPAGGEQ